MGNMEISMADGGKPFGGFWRRAVAAFIDAIILMAVISPFMIAGGMLDILAMDPDYIAANPEAAILPTWVGVAGGLIGLAYKLAFEATGLRATPGKLVLGLRVTDMDGQKLSFAAAAIRGWPWWAGSLIILLDSLAGTGQTLSNSASAAGLVSFIVCAFTARKQGIHDMMGKALVVRKAAQFSGAPATA